MTDVADRLRFVPNGTSFPGDGWELIARVAYDGADAVTHRELHGSEQRRCCSLRPRRPHRHHRRHQSFPPACPPSALPPAWRSSKERS